MDLSARDPWMAGPAFGAILREDARRIADSLGPDAQRLAGKTILVTGAAGFLCAYFLDVLHALDRDCGIGPIRLLALDNYLRGVPERLGHLAASDRVSVQKTDVSRPFEVSERVDFYIHGASIASPTFYRQYPLETIAVNVDGTRHVLDLARRGAESVIFLSSSEIYGDPDPASIPTREDYRGLVSCTGPRACYDESKRLGETLCVGYHAVHGVPVKMVRPFNVYGPGQRLDDRRIVPDLLAAVIAREPIVLFSDGRATRSFCYAGDFILGMLLTMLKGADGEPYNVGNDEELSIATAAGIAAGLANGPPLAVELRVSKDAHYLTDNPQRRCPDLGKIRQLGYVPRIGLREGLARTLASYGGVEP